MTERKTDRQTDKEGEVIGCNVVDQVKGHGYHVVNSQQKE